jgi:DNA repair protein RadB
MRAADRHKPDAKPGAFFPCSIVEGFVTGEDVSTGCAELDSLLGGGFDRGTVTQLYGPPAAGKTNVALSSVVEVVSDGGSALVIDTEGLSIERFEQILQARVDDVDAASSRVIVTAVHDFDEQAEAVRDASEFAERVDLIVLDSATGFYRIRRTEDENEGDALRQVTDQVTHLLSLARKHDLAVVITNQVYTDPETESDRTRPLGGHTLTHWTGVVVRLDRYRGGNRRATLEKHRSRPEGENITFTITGTGIESAEEMTQ